MALSLSPDNEPSSPPEPTLMFLASLEFQSLAVGGCSGKGKLALRSSTSLALSVFWPMTDC